MAFSFLGQKIHFLKHGYIYTVIRICKSNIFSSAGSDAHIPGCCLTFVFFCDDTDYCLRTVQAGFKILYVPTALMDKEKFFSNDSWSERNKKKKWKRFYQVRNSTYLSHHYGRNWAVRYLRGFNGVAGYILTALLTCPFTDAYQWSDIAKLWKAYCDGIHERLGIMK